MTTQRESIGARPSTSFAQAVRVGPTLYVSGQIATDNGVIVSDDAHDQAARCFDKLEAVLRDAGMQLADVVKLTCFMVDLADYSAYQRAKIERLPDTTAAGTAVVVAGLGVEGARFEVEAIAVRSDGAQIGVAERS